MKINGSNQPNLNAYRQLNKQLNHKKETNGKDQIEISNEAKRLHESKVSNQTRTEYVQEIKNKIDSGEYKVNYDKTAQKMIDFWTKL